ncbi:MAG: sel1 repeat family protein [Acidobacteria bacterium]|nr:sel1 repeat family protein [Acidobacteriota bacterium]
MYYKGEGVPQDYAVAAKWFRKAAEGGNPWSQAKLGALYYEGKGVPQDYVQAHMWANLAAASITVEE